MKNPSKETMHKYLTFHYWSIYLRDQGILSQREYLQMVSKIRSQYGVQ